MGAGRPSPGLAPPTSCAWGVPGGELPTPFRFESSRFWFPVALGPFIFFLRLRPAPGADVGARSLGSGCRIRLCRAARPGRERGVVRRGARSGPSRQSSRKAGDRGADPGSKGPRAPGRSPPPPASVPSPGEVAAPILAHRQILGGPGVEDSPATGGTFTLPSSSLEILRVWGGGAHSFLHCAWRGSLRSLWPLIQFP